MIENHLFRMPAILLAALALLGGCANLAPVRSFADETKQLSATFDPMLAGSVASCSDRYKRKKLIIDRNFDPVAAENAAMELCGPLGEENQRFGELNVLLEQYADTLAALADDKLPSYKAELDGLTASAGKLKKQGTQEPLIPPGKLSAVAALTGFLSRAATQRMQKRAIRDLLDHEEAIATVTDAMKDYAALQYLKLLQDERRDNAVLWKSLDLSTASEPLAANYMKTILLADERQIAAREKAVDAFVKAVGQLQKTNAEMRQKFDHLDDKELIAQIAKFSDEVFKLGKQVRSAF